MQEPPWGKGPDFQCLCSSLWNLPPPKVLSDPRPPKGGRPFHRFPIRAARGSFGTKTPPPLERLIYECCSNP